MKKLFSFILVLSFILPLMVFSANSFDGRKGGRKSKAVKMSKSSSASHHQRKSFKAKKSNSYLSGEKKNMKLKRMY